MKKLIFILVARLCLQGQTPDFYPQVRALVLEAEAASANMRLLKDRSNPHTWAGDILAHAGYLDDAERAFAKSPGLSLDPPFYLWRAWILYGQRERAEKFIESAGDPGKKASYVASFADLLWRMGKADEARARFEEARAIAAKTVDLTKRKQLFANIDQSLQFVSDPPPYLVSANPQPRPRLNFQDSTIPAFPISTDGFQDINLDEKAPRARADEELIRQLFARAAAGDLDGLKRIMTGLDAPFQKALALASMEHIFIQQHQLEYAEQYAMQIPEADDSSTLAKAEALTATAIQWLRKLDDQRARVDFDMAKKLVFSVFGLPFGKLSVLVSIADAQFSNGMHQEGDITFRRAIELANEFPKRPRHASGVRRPATPLGVHYQDEAFEKILRVAIHSVSVQIATEAADAWSRSGGNAERAMVDAWLAAGHTDEAIAVARAIKDPDTRVSELLSLARTLLSEAGAPIF